MSMTDHGLGLLEQFPASRFGCLLGGGVILGVGSCGPDLGCGIGGGGGGYIGCRI